MAIINSMGVGRARKSMGNVTYRTVRGRTIGSQKRSSGESGAITRGLGGNIRKPLFAMINMFMAAHGSDIDVSFDKTKYGSARNNFMKTNYSALSRALNTLATAASGTGELPVLSEVESAIATYAESNPTAIVRVKLAGFDRVYMSGAWTSDDNPVSGGGSTSALGTGTARSVIGSTIYSAPIAVTAERVAGARIVRPAGSVTLASSAIPSGITAADIKYLGSDGSEKSVTITEVASSTGNLSYTTTEVAQSLNVVAIQVGSVFVRITSAYTTSQVDEEDPLG